MMEAPLLACFQVDWKCDLYIKMTAIKMLIFVHKKKSLV